jgi:hypothetical protein
VGFLALSWIEVIVAVSQGWPRSGTFYVRLMLQTFCNGLLYLGSGGKWFEEIRSLGQQ